MIQIVCAVRDSAVEAFGRPFFEATKGSAIRAFTDACTNDSADNIFANHPEHFALFAIATYDDSIGLITPFERPEQLLLATDVKPF